MAAEITRVLIVEDHPLVRSLLTSLVQEQPRMEVVAQVATGEQALELMAKLVPNVVLTDLALPGINGFEVIRTVQQKFPDTCVIAVSNYPASVYETAVLEAGGKGFVPKDEAIDQLVLAIQTVRDGGSWTHDGLPESV